MDIRINKYLSGCGICSRRKADEYILAGKISINGETAELGSRVNPEKDTVTFDGKTVKKQNKNDFIYYALYKPIGFISSANDEKGRKTVVDLVPKEPRVYPIGRLDRDSSGLIILTNDGELTNTLTHPQYEHSKKYEVIIKTRNNLAVEELIKLKEEIKNKFLSGIKIEGNLMKADEIKIKISSQNTMLLNMVIHTGFNRQIRKMCDKVNVDVVSLKRVGIAKLKLSSLNLTSGKYIQIEKSEIL